MKDRNNLKYKILSQQWLILLWIILLISVLTALKNPRFLMLNNVMNIFEQIAVLGLVAAGATILIISGNFDISVGAVIGLSSCLMAMMMNSGIPIPAAAAAGIATAMFCTFFNGVLSILFKAPSFIISLATTSVYTGAALYLTKGVIQTVYGKFDAMNRFRLFGAIPLIFIISLIGCVVVGVGLPQISPAQDALRDYYQAARGSGFAYAYQFPGMNKVLQAAGRVIRTKEDRGVVLLIDSRYTRAEYRCLMPPHWGHLRYVSAPGQAQALVQAFWNQTKKEDEAE